MHYLNLAEQIASDHGYDLDDVVDDVFAIIARHRLEPFFLTEEQADRVRFEAIARAETIDSLIGDPIGE